MSSEDDLLQALVGIGAELSLIRKELQRLNGREPDADVAVPADNTSLTCRCGATFADEDAARRHAEREHNAPPTAAMDLITNGDQ